MTENPLLVPVELHAMVVNGRPRNFQRWQMNYNVLKYFQSPEPRPFQNDAGDNFAQLDENEGVYLMWTLPGALRHGYQKPGSGDIEFPLVPNRWLVVRSFGPADRRSAAAWVIESDYLNSARGSFYLNPAGKEPEQIQIGRSVPLSGWTETGNGKLFLRAVAPGNLMFSAYQPTCQNVFSFHDDLSNQKIIEADLSYWVLGWYSDPKADPLNQWPENMAEEGYRDALERLLWAVRAGSPPARCSIYHGMIFGVKWKKGTGEIPSPQPQDTEILQNKVKVAVGNTDAEALLALFKHRGIDGKPVPDTDLFLLEAFFNDLTPLLGESGGETAIVQKIRESWFAPQPGGLVWEAVDRPGFEKAVALTPEEASREEAILAGLNAKQAQLEQLYRKLHSWQRDLYELWWKNGYAANHYKAWGNYPPDCSPDQFAAVFDTGDPESLVCKINRLLDEIEALKAGIPSGTAAGTFEQAVLEYSAANNLPPSRCLQVSTAQRFWQPADPAILIAGINRGPAPDISGILACRTPDEVIGQWKYGVHDITLEKIQTLLPPLDLAKLPATVSPAAQRLYGEFLLLDPLNAATIARVLPIQDQTAVEDLANHMGTRIQAPGPQKLPGIDRSGWSQPWLPLYLDWEVDWYPIPYTGDGKRNWEFRDEDFQWTGPGGQTPPPVSIQGRSLLTAKTSQVFKSRLTRFMNAHPGEAGNLHQLLREVEGWDFLSQVLSGFNEQLALHDPSVTLIPDNTTPLFPSGRTMADLTGNRCHSVPNPGVIQSRPSPKEPWIDPDNPEWDPAPPEQNRGVPEDTFERNTVPSAFEAIRCGQFIFKRITVVDRFGQTAEIVTSQNSLTFHPIIADSLKPSRYILPLETGRLIQMAPRLLQSSRLNCGWASNCKETGPTTSTGNDTPVCGWVVPDYLDQALAIYDPQGACLGDVFIAEGPGGNPGVCWEPSPGGPVQTITEIAGRFPHLGMFLQKLLERGAPAYENLFTVIDESLWLTNPLHAQSGSNLAALFGRPLALVRTRLKLELRENPLADPGWPYTFQPQNAAFTGYDFLARLGDAQNYRDGLIGYFLDNDYSEFHIVHDPGLLPAGETYLKKIQTGNYLKLRPEKEVWVTVLMDPRLAVHIRTGILPVKALNLPERFIGPAMNAMEITFHAGPYLTYIETVSRGEGVENHPESQLLMPYPAGKNKGFRWLEKSAGNTWTEMDIAWSGETNHFPADLPVIRDGFLKFKGVSGKEAV